MSFAAGSAFAEAATSLAGTPYRLHGRDPASGLDCVGLVLAALELLGRPALAVRGYALHNLDLPRFLPLFGQAGFALCDGAIAPGDLLVVQPGPAQVHLLIAKGGGDFVHAHAGLRRVVVTPGPLTWPQLAHWRLQSD